MAVVPATRDDFEDIGRLNVMAYAEFARHMRPAHWQSMQTNLTAVNDLASRARFHIVKGPAGILGSVAYCPPGKSQPPLEDHWASLLLLAVHPDARGKGIGRLLTDRCVELAQLDGAPVIGLFTSELMGPAQSLYRGMGFLLDKELPPRYDIRYFRYKRNITDTA